MFNVDISILCWLSRPVVGVGGLLVVFVCLAHHEDVVSTSEGVGVHLDRVQVGVRVAALDQSQLSIGTLDQ